MNVLQWHAPKCHWVLAELYRGVFGSSPVNTLIAPCHWISGWLQKRSAFVPSEIMNLSRSLNIQSSKE